MAPKSVEMLARGLCVHAIHRGHGDALRSVADTFKSEGDSGIQRALEGSWPDFHVNLYKAAPLELAVSIVASAIADSLDAPDDQRRWARLGINAEERVLRIEGSLQWALIDLDGHGLEFQRNRVSEVQRKQGARAGRLKALELIEDQLLYPRALLPGLLGTEEEASTD